MDTPNENERSLAIGGAMGKRAMLYLGILVFAFALLLLISSSNASAADYSVSGAIPTQTWHTGDNVYVVGSITVNETSTLTIQTGVNVYFEPGTSLTVLGRLHAVSTDANRLINFTSNATSPSAGDWNGIIINSAVTPISTIDGAHIEFATTGVAITDSEVGLSNMAFNDISGNAIDASTSGPGDAVVTVSASSFVNIGGSAISVVAALDEATVTVTDVTISNAEFGIYVRALAGNITLVVDGLTADGIGAAGIQAWCNGLNDITLSNIALNSTGVEGLGFQSWSDNIVATVDACELTNISSIDAIVFNCFVGSVDATVTNVVITGAMDDAAIWVSANLSATVAIEGVEISGSTSGIYLASTFGTANLDLVDVLISDPNLNQGIIVVAEEANAIVTISGVTIEMNPTIQFFSDSSFDGINVMANLTVDFVAVDLTVLGGFDCVQLTSVNDGMSVDITGALITDGPQDGLLMNSGGELQLSIVNSSFLIDVDISVIDYFVTSTAIDGTAVGGVGATLTNVDIQWINGVSLVAEQENIDVVMTDVSFAPTANDTFFVGANGLYLASNEGSATVSLTNVDCILNATYPTFYSSGNGVVVEANGTVIFDAVDLTVTGADLNGVSVTSFNGAVEANISLADIEEIGGSGMLFYSEFDFVSLTLTDSLVMNCSLDGVVAQGVTDVTLEFNNVTVDGAVDGVFALSTDGNVTVGFTDSSVMNCGGTGIRILAPNGWITMVLDPSNVEFVGTGIYLDAMGSVDLSVVSSFVGFAETGIEIHSFDGGINVLFDGAELGFTDVFGLFADADNSDIMVSAINDTLMTNNAVAWYLVTSNGSVSVDVETSTFEYGDTGILVESSNELDANVIDSSFLGQSVLGMDLTADANITLNVGNSTFDGRIAEDAQAFYPTMSNGTYIIIQPEVGNWTTGQGMTATLPFGFFFNGATYTNVTMSLNGWLAFGSDGAPDVSAVYYFGSGSPNLIAPAQEIWSANDSAMDGYFHGMGYKYDSSLNAVIFQWFVWDATQPQLSNVFEVILYANGEIELRYAMMDGYNLPNYDFGINMFNGPSWNLGVLGVSALDMDFQSVFFTTETFSNGAAIFAIAGENMVATIDSSSFARYIGGGVLLVAVNGSASIDLKSSDFSFIYAVTQTMGAFVAAALNGLMTADVSGCSFDTIATAAIVLFDAPNLGGVDSFMVENNHFNEVIITTAIVSVINDTEQNESASYVSNKVFAQNDGTHVGIMAIATIVMADSVAWNIQETDVINNNNFTGEIDPWLLSAFGMGLTVPYLSDISVNLNLGVFNDVFVFESNIGDNQIVHSVSVSNNKLSEGPVDAVFALGQPMDVGAVTVLDVAMLDGANLAEQTDVSVIGNEISAFDAPLASGVNVVMAESLANPVDGLLNVTAKVNFVNNTLDSWFDSGVGLGFAVMQTLDNGNGNGMLNVKVIATGNMVSGFGDGIQVGVSTSADNLFGDVVSNVNTQIKDNEIFAYDDGIAVSLSTNTIFEHYFPPFEQVVNSNATMVLDVEIINNTVHVGNEGIYVETMASATEDEFGVFTNAHAAITGPVNVLDNRVDVYWDGHGIVVESYVSAAVSLASAMSDVPVTIVNNTVNADWYGTAISVGNFASASTLALRFNDQPDALMQVSLNVNRNSIYANSGIVIEQSSDATGGNSHSAVMSNVTVMANTLTGIDTFGISVNVSALSNEIDANPWAQINVTIVITDNNVTGYAGTGISVNMLPDVDSDLWVDITGSILIDNNTVSGVGVGIFVSTVVPAVISHNTMTDVVIGIQASGYHLSIFDNTIIGVIEDDGDGIHIVDATYLTIQGNMISNIGGDGISMVHVDNVLIKNNTFENIGGSGVYLSGDESTSYYLEVSNNTFTNIGDSGVEVNNLYGLWVLDNVMTNVSFYGVEVNVATNMFIENNTMSMMYGGVDLYNVSDANIMNNVMSAAAVARGVEAKALSLLMDVGYGVDVDNSDHILVTRNGMTGFGQGVEFDSVSDLIFTWNTVTGSLGDGGYFYVDGAVIANNVFSDNGLTGVIIEDSFMVTFANNEVTNNGLDGLLVLQTDSLTMVNGMFADNDMMGIELLNTSVDWNVNAESSVLRNDVLFSGDLVVMAGGSLKLDTVDFGIVPDMRDGLSSISVMANGALSAIDTDFYAVSYGIDGVGAAFGDYYEFNVYGTLEFINVFESDALELFLGPGSMATIETSTITNNVRNGIHIVDSSPVIMSCTIVSNPRNGIFIEGGAAAPRITDCIIADNNRGIYALNTKLESVTDNLIVLNSEAGLFGDNVTGSIHDNTFLLNHKEIYVRNSNVSIQDNMIGYTPLVQLLAQFVPLLQGFNLSTDIFLPELGLSINSMTVQNIIIGHVGTYAVNSEVRTSGNTFGMLSTAVQVVNTDLTFGDDIRQNTIIVPYMDNGGIIRNMSLPIPVWDGIIATNSHVVIRGASIDVLDDAVFLDNSTATISTSTLTGADFNLYLMNGSNATVSDSTFGKAGAEDSSIISVWEKLTVVVKDPWGAALANVPVTVGSKATTTDSNGMAVVPVLAYVMTASGKVPAAPSQVTANFTNVPTTSYPGHASWQTPVVSEQVTMNGPTTVVLVSGVIVRFDLTVHVLDRDSKNAVNVTVMLHDAASNVVAEAQTDANGTATFMPISYVKNADGTTDNHLTPYKVTATVGKDTAQGTTNLTGNTNLDIKVDLGPQFDYGPAIIIGVLVVIMFVATLIVVRRKP